MSEAAKVRPGILSDNAERLMCQTLRQRIYDTVSGPLFTRQELFAAKMKNVKCHDAGTLQRRYEAAQRIRQQREAAAGLAATFDAPAADYADEAAEMEDDYNQCDLDAA